MVGFGPTDHHGRQLETQYYQSLINYQGVREDTIMKSMVWMHHFVKMTMGISLLYSLLQVITAKIVIKGFAPHVRQLVTYTLGIGRNEKEYKHNLLQ